MKANGYGSVFALLFAALFFSPVAPGAEAAAAEVAAAPPAAIATEAFFRKPDYFGAKISPDGLRLAVTLKYNKQIVLQVLDLQTMKIVSSFNMQGNQDVGDFHWVSSKRLVFGSAVYQTDRTRPFYTNDLFATDYDGKNQRQLLGRLKSSFVAGTATNRRYWDLASTMPDDDDHILLVSYNLDSDVDGAEHFYRLNVNTGSKLDMGGRVPTNINGFNYIKDSKERIRIVTGSERKGDTVTYYRAPDSNSWKEIDRYKTGESGLQALAFTSTDVKFYATQPGSGGRDRLMIFDPETRTSELVYEDPVYDVNADLLWDRRSREFFGFSYLAQRNDYIWFKSSHPTAQNLKQIGAMFPAHDVQYVSSSDDDTVMVVLIDSDVEPGSYVVIDLKENKIKGKLALNGSIDPDRMSAMRSINFKARDGVELQGYLVMPAAGPREKLPMVVIPHGGPHGVRDYWGFDPEAQFLASHGYAVLQVDFRGSGGYGQDFLKSGYKHWGTTMQDDVTDATRWAIAQGFADPDRIAIYGASYGAYAAMMGAVREPDLYRAAAGYAGVYDLNLMNREGDIQESFAGEAYLAVALGNDSVDLAARSPARRASEIKIPVLLAHGKEDVRAPFAQYKAMAAALTQAGVPFESLVREKEEHGFFDTRNSVEFYDTLLLFLDKQLKKAHLNPRGSTASKLLGARSYGDRATAFEESP